MLAAIVLGAGIAGLSAGIALRDAGYSVSIHDRAPALEPVGAALSLWPNAVAALRRLGALAPIEAEAAPIRTMLLATRSGRPIIGPRRIGDDSVDAGHGYLPTRALLQRALLETLGRDVPVCLNDAAVGVHDHGDRAVVQFADGRRMAAALVIVADGIWSPIATDLLGNPPVHRGYGGVLGISTPVPPDGHEETVAEYWARGERFGLCDVGAGRRYWFHMTDAGANAPPPTHDAVMRHAAGWPPGIAHAVAATLADRLIPFSIHARPAPRRLGRGRIICVGDAAHAMEPNLGQGGCQALEDAAALRAIALRTEPAAILTAFEAARLVRVRRIVRRSAEGRRGAHGAPVMQALTGAALRALPAGLHERVIAGLHRAPAY